MKKLSIALTVLTALLPLSASAAPVCWWFPQGPSIVMQVHACLADGGYRTSGTNPAYVNP